MNHCSLLRDRRNFFRGLVDKYTWVDVGSSFLPSDLLAAMLLAQLEDREWVWERRSTIWHRYADELASLIAPRTISSGLSVPVPGQQGVPVAFATCASCSRAAGRRFCWCRILHCFWPRLAWRSVAY